DNRGDLGTKKGSNVTYKMKFRELYASRSVLSSERSPLAIVAALERVATRVGRGFQPRLATLKGSPYVSGLATRAQSIAHRRHRPPLQHFLHRAVRFEHRGVGVRARRRVRIRDRDQAKRLPRLHARPVVR